MTLATDLTADWVSIHARPPRGMPALFVDRDGTLIENVPYLADPDGVRPLAGAREAIASFRAAGYLVIMVTNQSGVARGLCSIEQYRAVEGRVIDLFGAGAIDAVYACPYHPAGQAPFAGEHPWRKPRPGMLLAATERFGLDLDRSLMVGDSLSDIQAGAEAGARWLVHTSTGHGVAERPAVEAFAATLSDASSQSEVRFVSHIGELDAAEYGA